jgi:lipopolysaccharide transport system ATP-binding protein
MSFNDFAIRVSNLGKTYDIYDKPSDRLKRMFLPRFGIGKMLRNKQFGRRFQALNDISFEIKKGETVGIVGKNGSGKSTLLQIVCGTLTPSTGTVEVSGRIAALLELGSGFNPEFTGRENIYMNAVILGLERDEVTARLQNIIDFADIGAFIDQPVKTYSSGMYVRLAFAVIAHVDAEILVIDEALAVGDIFFQQKCMRFLRSHQEKGGTVIFVSHDTSAVINLCDRAILLSRNNSPVIGNTDEICRAYVKELYAEREFEMPNKVQPNGQAKNGGGSPSQSTRVLMGEKQSDNIIRIGAFRSEADSFGSGGAKIENAWFEDDRGNEIMVVSGGDKVFMCVQAVASSQMDYAVFGFMIKDRLGQYIFAEGTDFSYRNSPVVLSPGEHVIAKFGFFMPTLIQGDYSINIALANGMGDSHMQQHWINDAIGLHSLKSRLVHGICGLQDFSVAVQIMSVNASVSE